MTKKSFIKTIGSKGLLSDYNTEGKKLQTELTAGDNVSIANNVISSNQVFVATYGTTTYDEIKAAYDAGKICTVFRNGRYYYMTWINRDYIQFSASNENDRLYQVSVNSVNKWAAYSIQLQSKLTFDTTPTAGSNNPVTSNGILNMKPLFTRFDNETNSRLIVFCKFDGNGECNDIARKFGLQYGKNSELLFQGSVKKDNTTEIVIKILNDSKVNVNATKRLKSSIFNDSSNNSYFAIWLDGSISQPGWAYYSDYYPDTAERAASHFTVFDPSTYTLVRDLTIKYEPSTLPYNPSTTGTQVLKCINGVIQWVNE